MRLSGGSGQFQAAAETTAKTPIRTARAMSEDLAAWQDLYGRKRLMLPA